MTDELRKFDDEQGESQDGEMDKEERQASIQWRSLETNERIRRKDNTIEQGD